MDYEIDTKLTWEEYMGLVPAMVDGFFDENGNYVPHIGMLGVLTLFHNNCLYGPDGERIPRITSMDELAEFLEDDEFMMMFNDAISIEFSYGDYDEENDENDLLMFGEGFNFDFANAYEQAMDIVDHRANTLGNAVQVLSVTLEKWLKKFSELATEDNIKLLYGIVENLAKEPVDLNDVAGAIVKNRKKEE